MKKNILFIMSAVLILAACTPKSADQASTGEAIQKSASSGSELSLNTEESTIFWRGTKVGGEHTGYVSATSGSIFIENGEITGGSITIDLNSITNEDLEGDMNARLVGHLKSEDFFYTEKFPEAVFEIVSVSEFSGETTEGEVTPTHEITGNLSMRGETKSISFPARVTIEEGRISALTNEFSIDRTQWGVNFKSKTIFAEFKDDFIADLMNLKLDVSFSE